jgi:hypothetical protein
MVSGPLSTLKNIRLSFARVTVITLASIIGFSETEKGVSTGAVSCGLNVAVRMKKVSNSTNRSTIGVMSIRGDLVPNLIFGIF